MNRLIALSLMLCACNWKYEIVACKPGQCNDRGKYTIIFQDPAGRKYSLDNCPQLLLETKKDAREWAMDFKLNPTVVFEDGSRRANCLKRIK